jgi:hypothetical protein
MSHHPPPRQEKYPFEGILSEGLPSDSGGFVSGSGSYVTEVGLERLSGFGGRENLNFDHLAT